MKRDILKDWYGRIIVDNNLYNVLGCMAIRVLLLATSCDGTLATAAIHTTVRVVCHNTLAIALNASSGVVKVPHSTTFNAEDVKRKLGVAVSQWDSFMYRMLSDKHFLQMKNYVLFLLCCCLTTLS